MFFRVMGLSVLGVVLSLSSAPGAPSYHVVDPGMPEGAQHVYGVALNNHGDFVGQYVDNAVEKPFRYRNGQFEEIKLSDLGPYTWFSARVLDINDRGDMVGTGSRGNSSAAHNSWVLRGEEMLDCFTTAVGQDFNPNVEVAAINNLGQATGSWNGLIAAGFIASPEQTILQAEEFRWRTRVRCRFLDINDRGQVLGREDLAYPWMGPVGVVYDRGHVGYLNVPGLAEHTQVQSEVKKIDNMGRVYGNLPIDRCGFIHRGCGDITYIMPPEGTAEFQVCSANDWEEVVGTFRDPGTGWQGFFYAEGELSLLKDLLPEAAGMDLLQPVDINNKGEILAKVNRGGEIGTVLLVPDSPRDILSPLPVQAVPAPTAATNESSSARYYTLEGCVWDHLESISLSDKPFEVGDAVRYVVRLEWSGPVEETTEDARQIVQQIGRAELLDSPVPTNIRNMPAPEGSNTCTRTAEREPHYSGGERRWESITAYMGEIYTDGVFPKNNVVLYLRNTSVYLKDGATPTDLDLPALPNVGDKWSVVDTFTFQAATIYLQSEVTVVDISETNPLLPPPPPVFHSADTNEDAVIDTAEMLRVIQLYNAGAYHCDSSAPDGYAPGIGDTTCEPHASDFMAEDWSIGLSELSRLVQLRTWSAIEDCEAGEDGFCRKSETEAL